MFTPSGCSRRSFLGGLAWGAAALSAPGAWAEELVQTPDQTEGPFYPDHLPLDTDNDLVVINDALDSAVGEITYLSGRILDAAGNPVRNAVVEIWQVDNNAAYLHTGSDNHDRRDGNFQGFGRFTTGRTGEYLFRTIKPVPYPGRTPHIHVGVNVKGQPKIATQCYIKDHPGNARDFVLANVRDERARESLMVDFAPLEGSRIGELAATFDVVLGFTRKAETATVRGGRFTTETRRHGEENRETSADGQEISWLPDSTNAATAVCKLHAATVPRS